jgi:hypothetical protein
MLVAAGAEALANDLDRATLADAVDHVETLVRNP